MFDIAKFRTSAIARDLLARSTFTAVAAVPLFDWDELDEATCWCASRWQENSKHFRRFIDAEAETARFEFADTTHAVEFRLRFG